MPMLQPFCFVSYAKAVMEERHKAQKVCVDVPELPLNSLGWPSFAMQLLWNRTHANFRHLTIHMNSAVKDKLWQFPSEPKIKPDSKDNLLQ